MPSLLLYRQVTGILGQQHFFRNLFSQSLAKYDVTVALGRTIILKVVVSFELPNFKSGLGITNSGEKKTVPKILMQILGMRL